MNSNFFLQELIGLYKENSIDISCPGFYNDPNFVKLEQQNPEFLNQYASFVQQKDYSFEYLEKAEKTIEVIGNILFKELMKSNQLGRCIDVSMILAKILEKEQLWNFAMVGALAVEFPTPMHIPNSYFYMHDINKTAGHVWLYAPPFKLIDLTLKFQQYLPNQKRGIARLPGIALEKGLEFYTPQIKEICSPEFRSIYKINNIPKGIEMFQNTFHPFKINYKNAVVKYIPCGITASDGSLEENTSIQLNGRVGIEIYDQLIKPELNKLGL